VVGVRQARLEVTDDLAEETRREETRSQGAGCILADGRQQQERHPDRRGHVIDLPADLLAHSFSSVRRGETSGFRGVCRCTQGMCPHMRGRCGLTGRPSGRGRCRNLQLARWNTADEAATDALCDVKFTACESPRPVDQISRAAVPWRCRLEDSQYVLCAIRRPRRDSPPVGFAERLWGAHTLDASSGQQYGCSLGER
jgi:hypothetical protein